MALMKAFMCQVVLLGLYKLFLEQVVEDYLVPDELTRNCLVGFICLMCFGIQLYTDRAEDDIAEVEEDPKAKSKARESTGLKKFESAEISVSHDLITETVGSNASSSAMITKTQTASKKIATENKPFSKNQNSKGENSALSSTKYEEVIKVSHSTIFSEFSTNAPNTTPNVTKVDRDEVAASTEKTSCEQEVETIPVLNGLSENYACEESDEEAIEIDQFVSKEPVKEDKQSNTAEAVQEIKADYVIDSGMESDEVEVSKTEMATDAAVESDAAEDVEAIKPELVPEAVMESNGLNNSSMKDLDSDSVNNESESQMIKGTVEESVENKEIASNITGETEVKNPVKDGNQIGDGQDTTFNVASEPDALMKDIAELFTVQEKECSSSSATKAVNEVETVLENNSETSTVANTTAIPSRQKLTSTRDICVAPVSIDISFIYACH